MCDYSLEIYHSRPAVYEELYTLHRFRSGSMGFIAGADCDTAVCMPAGTRLHLEGLNKTVQRAMDVGSAEDVVMVRLPLKGNTHRDAVRFANGREALLQNLNAGVCATLMLRDLTKILELDVGARPDLIDSSDSPVGVRTATLVGPSFGHLERPSYRSTNEYGFSESRPVSGWGATVMSQLVRAVLTSWRHRNRNAAFSGGVAAPAGRLSVSTRSRESTSVAGR